MSRRRYISTDISTDPRIAELAEHGALPVLLYTWAITHADDWGRMTGDARQFKLLVCPGFDVTARDVDDALTQIASVGLWLRYSVEGRSFLAFPPAAWFRYQTYIGRDKRVHDSSAFPAPADAAYLVALPEVTPDVASESYQITAQSSQSDVLVARGSANHRALPQNTEERRESPQNAEERRRTPLRARTPSPSPSLSPSIDTQHGDSSEKEIVREAPAVLAADAALSLTAPAPLNVSSPPPQPAMKRKPATVTPIAAAARVERARDPVWDACIDAMGAVPSNDTERGKWAKGIKSLKQSLLAASPGVMAITPEMAAEIAVRCTRYRTRFGATVPLNPMALAGNWTTLAVDIDQSQEVQRHGHAFQRRYAGDGRSGGRSAGNPAVGTPAYYAQARAAQANDHHPDRRPDRISDVHAERYPAGGAGEGRDALALGHW